MQNYKITLARLPKSKRERWSNDDSNNSDVENVDLKRNGDKENLFWFTQSLWTSSYENNKPEKAKRKILNGKNIVTKRKRMRKKTEANDCIWHIASDSANDVKVIFFSLEHGLWANFKSFSLLNHFLEYITHCQSS